MTELWKLNPHYDLEEAMRDIVEQLQEQIHLESAAIAPQTSALIEVAKLAIEEIERLRAALALYRQRKP